jgi:hypothetical protein
MKISHDDEGYHAYCFRCSEGGFKAHGLRRISDVFAEREFCYAKNITLPTDFTKEVPDFASVWYLKAGVNTEMAQGYGIGWSDKLQRVLLPVYNGDELVVVQARAVHKGQHPKYLNQQGNKKSLTLFKSHSYTGSGAVVCITEDILSCIRVGEVVPCVCCMGTSLSDAQAGQLLGYDSVAVWLDNDQAGWKGSSKMHRKLSPVVSTRVIHAEADPKCYDNQAIKEIING